MKIRYTRRLMQVFAAMSALALMFAVGCGDGKDGHDHGPDGHHDDEGHNHPPPRGGIMIELGKHEFQLEFKIEKDRNTFTMWVMDGHAEGAVKIAEPQVVLTIKGSGDDAKPPAKDVIVTLKAVTNENTGEKVGDTSQFDAPVAELQGLTKFEGTIGSITIRGKAFKNVKLSYDQAKVK